MFRNITFCTTAAILTASNAFAQAPKTLAPNTVALYGRVRGENDEDLTDPTWYYEITASPSEKSSKILTDHPQTDHGGVYCIYVGLQAGEVSVHAAAVLLPKLHRNSVYNRRYKTHDLINIILDGTSKYKHLDDIVIEYDHRFSPKASPKDLHAALLERIGKDQAQNPTATGQYLVASLWESLDAASNPDVASVIHEFENSSYQTLLRPLAATNYNITPPDLRPAEQEAILALATDSGKLGNTSVGIRADAVIALSSMVLPSDKDTKAKYLAFLQKETLDSSSPILRAATTALAKVGLDKDRAKIYADVQSPVPDRALAAVIAIGNQLHTPDGIKALSTISDDSDPDVVRAAHIFLQQWKDPTQPVQQPGGSLGKTLPTVPLTPIASTEPSSPASSPHRTNMQDKADMIWIAPGTFPMGEVAGATGNNPRHEVNLTGYWIYKNPVTVKMYQDFCNATGRRMPTFPSGWGNRPNDPIVNVSWEDAKAYCDWAGVRLPTEAQWEKAARGTDARQYPWGDYWDPTRLWCSLLERNDTYKTREDKSRSAEGHDTPVGATITVGSFSSGQSPYGVLDMAGNVQQWCLDSFDQNFWMSDAAKKDDPVNTVPNSDSAKDFCVLRGNSFMSLAPADFVSAHRVARPRTSPDYDIGFRCVSLGPPP